MAARWHTSNLYNFMIHTIDATGKTLGRTATKVASILMGKDTTSYAPNIVPKVTVKLTNVGKAKVDPRKMDEKTYKRYSGYPGGLREDSMKHVVSRKGYAEVFRTAVYGMLPKNKLRDRFIKNLIITE